MEAAVNLRALASISAFASTEETRYYLNGVCLEIEPRSVTYIATDGHRIVAHRLSRIGNEGDNTLLGRFIIPTEQCRAHKLKRKDEPDGVLKGSGNRLTLARGTLDITFDPIVGTFPDWRKVIPEGKASGVPGQFNWELAAAFEKLSKQLDLGTVSFVHNGPTDPTIVSFDSSLDTVGVLMPMRKEPRLVVAPTWAVAA